MYIITVLKDKSIKEEISKLFSIRDSYDTIHIKLPLIEWISANSLNFLVTFIVSNRYHFHFKKIIIELFEAKIISDVLEENDVSEEILDSLTKKLIFYESMELYENINYDYVIQFPNCDTLKKVKELLVSHEYEKKWMYSSKMLALNPLINDEKEQIYLTARLNTLTNIIFHNLYGKVDYGEAREASSQIMYELVKNIYQHAYSEDISARLEKHGIACAQINKFPIIQNKEYSLKDISGILELVKKRTKGKVWKFLSISICDFGVGINSVIRTDLKSKLTSEKSDFTIGEFTVNEELLADDYKLIEIPIRTEYSTKTLSDKREDWTISKERKLVLSRRGRGYIFCICFVGEFFGRMQIRSNNYVLDVFAKESAALRSTKWRTEPEESLAIIEKEFGNYFQIIQKKEKGFFPGTQIIIEIPVEVFQN